MPAYNKQFGSPQNYDHEIQDLKGKKIGTVRVKPTGIAWKPRNARKFYSVSLDKFTEWIMGDESGARQTKS